jgi:error-prone DNA polymerase
MGWSNPPVPWREIERRLSGRTPGVEDAPVSRKRRKPVAESVVRPEEATPYAELHCHSHFSFLDGASSPADLVAEATRLGLSALALTDHDGFHGAPLFAEFGRDYGMPTVFGAELSLGLTGPQNGVPDPEGKHLLVLARGVEGYHRLAGAMTEAHLRGDEKGRPAYDLDELTDRGRGHWVVLTGCRKGQRTAAEIDDLVDRFGRDHVVVELNGLGKPGDDEANDLLYAMAREKGLIAVATGNVHHATPERRRLAAAMASIRARRSIAELDGWLDLSGSSHLRSGAEMEERYHRYPGVIAATVPLAAELAFDLRKASPKLPKQGIPAGETPGTWLRKLTEKGFAERYAHTPHAKEARARVEAELEVILRKDFAGYFVIVHDIVKFARDQGILCQGRGSAASSAVCYALGITAIDSVFYPSRSR